MPVPQVDGRRRTGACRCRTRGTSIVPIRSHDYDFVIGHTLAQSVHSPSPEEDTV